jgi:hypothetical protein
MSKTGTILKNDKDQQLIFENVKLGILVAIQATDQVIIKKFWKTYKGKSIIPEDEIEGFPMINDDEFNSLKIDFDSPSKFLIKDLKFFK